ncbi:unnamed protein product [Ilex paraguariensis]|uniref:Myb/SANT-like domain-containing protein n=1 Tax=Ilex paraguariensis TaxID=185542 RepID=A0ABC8QLI1_9AQUA
MANVNVNQNLDNVDVMEIEPTKVNQPWPTKNETIFIELMDEQVALKNRSNTTFTRHSWNYILQELKRRTGYACTHEQLKNKFNALSQVWKDFHKLVTNTTGLVNKRAKKIKKKGCPYYEALYRIYQDTIATGKHAHPSTKPPFGNEEEHNPNYDPKDEEANENDDDNPVDTKCNRSRSTTPTSSQQPKRETYGRALTSALTMLANFAKLRASYYKKKIGKWW